MAHHWDEFSKLLAEHVPRRESLRRLGITLAATVLSPLGPRTASAGHHPQQQTDRCKSFCNCRNKRQQDQCLRVCKACHNVPGRVGGSCGSYFCCRAGQTSCGSYCADLANDPFNCGACGSVCDAPGGYGYRACADGVCGYSCEPGAVLCDGTCTFLGDDYNCGACGRVCGDNSTCYYGECINITGEF